MQFNFLILSTDGRFRTMANMSLDNEYKFELAKTGLFSHNNLIKCIGCRTILDKINAKQIKRHTYSDYCISSTNALMFNESMRKNHLRVLKISASVCITIRGRWHVGSSRFLLFWQSRSFTLFRMPYSFKYKSVDDAQRRHKQNCKFVNAIEDYSVNEHFSKLDVAEKEILAADLSPPQLSVKPSAPPAEPLTQHVSECKVCFDRENRCVSCLAVTWLCARNVRVGASAVVCATQKLCSASKHYLNKHCKRLRHSLKISY